jgi:hypothetical protein
MIQEPPPVAGQARINDFRFEKLKRNFPIFEN